MMQKRSLLLLVVIAILVLAGLGALVFHPWRGQSQSVSAAHQLIRPLGCVILDDGRYLITDGGGVNWTDQGSKILIINRQGTVEWSFDQGLRFAHSAIMLRNGNVLIPDTNNDRLLEVDPDKRIVWSSESWGDGSGRLPDGSHLNYPNYVQELDDEHFLVSDRLNSRVIEIDRAGKVYWQFTGASKQHAPKYIGDGRYLIADSDHNRIIEIDQSGQILWSYSAGLSWPRDAVKLSGGNILITDSRNNRLLFVTPEGTVVNEIKGHFSAPYQANLLSSGNILVCDAQHGRLLEVTPDSQITWDFCNRPQPKLSTRLANGNIEELDSSGQPLSWMVCDLQSHNTGRWSVDSNISRNGQHSLAIEGELGSAAANKWWGQVLKVKPGTQLKLTAYAKTEDVRGGAAISIGYLDELGGAMGGVNSAILNGTNDWRELTIIFQVPQGITQINISLSLIGAGMVWFDDVSLDKM
ncbi:MAG TPA: hypothetical protein DF292_02625 [Firmicutes bacterium]|nr:hypothetical protein [Bacillota bacterium]HCT35916.1 hypothetical protein [Bacillota bacterium]